MKAIILAAGRGSRMKASTEDRPKCLVQLAGRSLLEHQLGALRAAGAGPIAAVIGYRGAQLEGYGLTLFENPRWADTNMVRSLAQAAVWLREEPCLVSYADIFYPAETVRRLIAAPPGLAISYDPDWLHQWQARFADPLSDAESFQLDASGSVVDIGRKVDDLALIQGQYMGLLRFDPPAWKAVEVLLAELPAEVGDKLDMTSLLRRLIGMGQRIAAIPTVAPWGEVDSEADLAFFAAEHAAGRFLLDGAA